MEYFLLGCLIDKGSNRTRDGQIVIILDRNGSLCILLVMDRRAKAVCCRFPCHHLGCIWILNKNRNPFVFLTLDPITSLTINLPFTKIEERISTFFILKSNPIAPLACMGHEMFRDQVSTFVS